MGFPLPLRRSGLIMQRELLWLGMNSRMKNDSEIEPKIHFRRDFMLTTHFTYKKQLKAVLTEEDEIRTCRYFIWIFKKDFFEQKWKAKNVSLIIFKYQGKYTTVNSKLHQGDYVIFYTSFVSKCCDTWNFTKSNNFHLVHQPLLLNWSWIIFL